MKLIAETAWHHQGDIHFFRELIAAIGELAVHDMLKFHVTIDFDAYMQPDHPAFATLKRWLISPSEWDDLLKTASRGGELMLLYNDTAAVEFGQRFRPALTEIHAVNLNNIHLLDCLKNNLEKGQKVVLGIGGNELEDIDLALNRVAWDDAVLMFGFQNYPTRLETVNFRKMRRVMERYPSLEFGYADHCAWNEPDNLLVTIMGAALGMAYIEKHVTLEPGVERCDWQSCISLEQLAELRRMLDVLVQCQGDGSLALSEAEREYGKMGLMKALAVTARPLVDGSVLAEQDIRFTRSGATTDVSQREVLNMIGRTVATDLAAGTVLQRTHFAK